MKYQYPCPVCEGDGMIVCDCCGNETDCDDCDASGLDVARVDVEKFNEAEKAARKLHDSSSWSLMENGIAVGRCGGILGAPPVWSLRYDDFLRGDAVTANRRRGFTISEMLACMTILAILLAILTPILAGSLNSSRNAACLANIRTIGQLATVYHDANRSRWPRQIAQLELDDRRPPLTCPRDRTPDALRSHGLWDPAFGMAAGVTETPTLEARVDQASPPGLLMVSDISLWTDRQETWRNGSYTGDNAARRIK